MTALSTFGYFFILDAWSVFQDFPGLAAEHYKTGRFLSIFHLQTAVLQTTALGLNFNTQKYSKSFPTNKKEVTFHLASEVKD